MATTRATGRESNPVDDEFLHHLYRGGELLAAGKVIEAKDFLERAHKLQPKNEKGQNLLGLTYFKLGLFDRAAELYEMLVRDNPVDPTLRVNLGLVYLKTNALQRAVREFEVAVDLAPDHKKAHNYLGLALAQQHEYGRAREHFLQAGSDAMAEKMSRAIAGEGFSRPAPVQPAKARGFAELEGAEVVREHGGEPVAETPPPAGSEMEIEVVEETPAQQQAAPEPPPAPPAFDQEAPPVSEQEAPSPPAFEGAAAAVPPPLPPKAPKAPKVPAEDDWGAQFGIEDTAQQTAESQGAPEAAAFEAPAPSEAPAAVEEIPISEVEEVPAAPPAAGVEAVSAAQSSLPELTIEEVSEDGMPVLTAEPENPEDLAAIAQHELPLSGATQVFASPPPPPPEDSMDAAFAESPAAAAVSEPEASLDVAPEVPPQAVPEPAQALEARPAEPPASSMETPGPAPVAPAVGKGLAGRSTWRDTTVPILGEYAPSVTLGGAGAASPFSVGVGGFTAWVEGELLTRLEGLVAFSGPLTFKPEMKRFRGRTTDKPFGEGSARMVRATGRGMLFIEPQPERTFQAVDLGDESAYLRDEYVFAFEEPVMFENGRVPSDVAPDLDLVHLRGNGKVLLSLEGPLRSVPVTMEAAVTVPLTHLVGWQGNLTPKVVALLVGPGGEVLKTAVELSGEGFALLGLPVR